MPTQARIDQYNANQAAFANAKAQRQQGRVAQYSSRHGGATPPGWATTPSQPEEATDQPVWLKPGTTMPTGANINWQKAGTIYDDTELQRAQEELASFTTPKAGTGFQTSSTFTKEENQAATDAMNLRRSEIDAAQARYDYTSEQNKLWHQTQDQIAAEQRAEQDRVEAEQRNVGTQTQSEQRAKQLQIEAEKRAEQDRIEEEKRQEETRRKEAEEETLRSAFTRAQGGWRSAPAQFS